jgi:hypothetical protein
VPQRGDRPTPTPELYEYWVKQRLALPFEPGDVVEVDQEFIDGYAPRLKGPHHAALLRLVAADKVQLRTGGRPNVPDRRMDGGSQ